MIVFMACSSRPGAAGGMPGSQTRAAPRPARAGLLWINDSRRDRLGSGSIDVLRLVDEGMRRRSFGKGPRARHQALARMRPAPCVQQARGNPPIARSAASMLRIREMRISNPAASPRGETAALAIAPRGCRLLGPADEGLDQRARKTPMSWAGGFYGCTGALATPWLSVGCAMHNRLSSHPLVWHGQRGHRFGRSLGGDPPCRRSIVQPKCKARVDPLGEPRRHPRSLPQHRDPDPHLGRGDQGACERSKLKTGESLQTGIGEPRGQRGRGDPGKGIQGAASSLPRLAEHTPTAQPQVFVAVRS